MLFLLNAVQLVLYIALLGLAGQGALFVLAGARREHNVFYQLLRLLGMPFTRLVARLLPSKVARAHVPLITFFLLLLLYVVVTFEKISLCLGLGLAACR